MTSWDDLGDFLPIGLILSEAENDKNQQFVSIKIENLCDQNETNSAIYKEGVSEIGNIFIDDVSNQMEATKLENHDEFEHFCDIKLLFMDDFIESIESEKSANDIKDFNKSDNIEIQEDTQKFESLDEIGDFGNCSGDFCDFDYISDDAGLLGADGEFWAKPAQIISEHQNKEQEKMIQPEKGNIRFVNIFIID